MASSIQVTPELPERVREGEEAAEPFDRLTRPVEGEAGKFDSLHHHAVRIADAWARDPPAEAAVRVAGIPDIDQRAATFVKKLRLLEAQSNTKRVIRSKSFRQALTA
jgi:hypothetical protein